MDKDKSRRVRDEDVPSIGDLSDAQNTRLRAGASKASAPHPHGAGNRARDDRWVIDSRDVDRYARIAGARKRQGLPAQALKYAPIAVVLVVAFAVYWNFETLREIQVDFAPLTKLRGNASTSRNDASGRGEPGVESVEAPAVVGEDAALDGVEDAPPAAEAGPGDAAGNPADAPADAPAVAPEAPPSLAGADAPASGPPERPRGDSAANDPDIPNAAPPPEPAAPVEPETFVFAVATTSVVESAPTAAVLILRNGGNRGLSSVTWWTSGGTATPGRDYADLGRVVESFPAGAQNRTIRIPIVGDRVAEGPETFYVHLAPGDGAGAPADEQRIEVVIQDDD